MAKFLHSFNLDGKRLCKMKWTEKVDRKSGQKTRDVIIALISSNPHITTAQMSESLGINRSALSKHIKRMQENGIIRRVGPDKGGFWEVISD